MSSYQYISLHLLLIYLSPFGALALSIGGGGGSTNPSFSLSDRFTASCPADLSSISQFDPSLISYDDDDSKSGVWVAVYRSSNNLPSVLIKDDFMNAMRIATSVQSASIKSTQITDISLTSQIENSSGKNDQKNDNMAVKARTPVAVAKLSPSSNYEGKWLLESMRCSLKKEDTDDSCDGLSEHAEAISICIDELILNHLRKGNTFDKTIRTKATLVSGILLEKRGFLEVNELCSDMVTHISSLEGSLCKYAERVVETVSRSPGARDRALQILNYLGKEEVVEHSSSSSSESPENEQDYDPWANVGIL